MPQLLSDDERNRVREAATKAGVSLTLISQQVGKNPGWLARHLRDGGRDFTSAERQGIASLTGVSPIWLATGAEVPLVEARTVGGHAGLLAAGRSAVNYFAAGARDLPLYRGVSVGGTATVGLTPDPRELTERPAMLAGVPDGFAVRISDDRLRPRYSRGDTLYFHPGSAPEAGDCVALELADGSRRVGVLVAGGQAGVTIESLSPRRSETFAGVVSVAREVGVARR